MTIDVTENIQQYRLALRHIWNSYFWPNPEMATVDGLDAFRKLQRPIYEALVAFPLDLAESTSRFGDRFAVVPNGGWVSIQIDRNDPSDPHTAGIWSIPQGPFKKEELSFTLIDIFGFSPFGVVDYPYYVVRIASLLKDSSQVGHRALVGVTEADVWLTLDSGHSELGTRYSAPQK